MIILAWKLKNTRTWCLTRGLNPPSAMPGHGRTTRRGMACAQPWATSTCAASAASMPLPCSSWGTPLPSPTKCSDKMECPDAKLSCKWAMEVHLAAKWARRLTQGIWLVWWWHPKLFRDQGLGWTLRALAASFERGQIAYWIQLQGTPLFFTENALWWSKNFSLHYEPGELYEPEKLVKQGDVPKGSNILYLYLEISEQHHTRMAPLPHLQCSITPTRNPCTAHWLCHDQFFIY